MTKCEKEGMKSRTPKSLTSLRVLCGREEQEETVPVVTVCKVRMVSMVQRAEPGKAGLAEWQYTAFGITVYPTNKEVKAACMAVEKACR